jgi:hypothetical protein
MAHDYLLAAILLVLLVREIPGAYGWLKAYRHRRRLTK